MGLIEKLMGFVFQGGFQSTVEVFRENSEKLARRAQKMQIRSKPSHKPVKQMR